MHMTRWRFYLLCGLGSLLVIGALYWPIVLRGEGFYYRDIARGYLPEKIFQGDTVRQGFWPFWNKKMFCGLPHHATLAAQLYYPLNALFWFKPYYWFYSLNTLFHLFLGCLGVAFWMRGWLCADGYSLGAAMLWPILGCNVALIEFFPMIAALAYVPWILGMMIRAANVPLETAWRWWGWAGVAFGLQLLVNYPTIGLYTFLLEFNFALAGPWKTLGRRFKGMLAVGLIGSLIFGIQLLPTVELTLRSVRGTGLSYELSNQIPLTPLHFANLMALYKWQFPQDALLFLGWVIGFGAIWGMFMRPFRILVAGALFWFVAALGSATPVHPLLYHFLPLMKYDRKPFSLAIMASILLFFLAIKGWEEFADNSRLKNRSTWLMVLLAAIAWIATGVIGLLREDILVWWFFGISDQKRIYEGVREFMLLSKFVQGAAVSLSLMLAGIRFWTLSKRHMGFLVLAFIGVSGAFPLALSMNPTTSEAFFESCPPLGKAILNQSETGRVFMDEQGYQKVVIPHYLATRQASLTTLLEWKNTLEPRFPMTLGLDDAKGNGSILPKAYLQIIDTWDAMYASATIPDFRMLQSVGVRYLISPRRFPAEALRLIATGPLALYALPGTRPREGLCFEAEVTSSSIEIPRRMSQSSKPIESFVYLESPIPIPPGGSPRWSVTASPTADPNRFELRYSSEFPGILYLLDQMYPGWIATLDGREIPIFLVDGWAKGIQAPAGSHEVTFQFRPNQFIPGLVCTLLGFLAAFFCILRKHQ